MTSERIENLARELNGVLTEEGLRLQARVHNGDLNMIQVVVEDREEFPIVVTMDEDQILCTTHLWRDNEVVTETRIDLMEAMLTMNLPMPLSSFGKVGDQYLLFGALSLAASLQEVLQEIVVLSENTLGAIEAVADYLK